MHVMYIVVLPFFFFFFFGYNNLLSYFFPCSLPPRLSHSSLVSLRSGAELRQDLKFGYIFMSHDWPSVNCVFFFFSSNYGPPSFSSVDQPCSSGSLVRYVMLPLDAKERFKEEQTNENQTLLTGGIRSLQPLIPI